MTTASKPTSTKTEAEDKPEVKSQTETEPKDDNKSEAAEVKTETVNFYNPNDGIHGRTGGPYLDQVQQVEQERLNAFREGRDPDFDNLPLTPGIVPVLADKLVQGYNSTALDGQSGLSSVEIKAPVLASAEVKVGKDGKDEAGFIEQTGLETVKPEDTQVLGNTDLFN